MERVYVKAYYDWIEQMEKLTDAEIGRLFIGILEYARSGVEPEFSGREEILFPVFKAQMARDEKQTKANQTNGSKGGRPKKEETENNPTEPIETENNPSEPIETEKTEPKPNKKKEIRNKKKEKEEEYISSSSSPACAGEAEEVVNVWNTLGLNKVTAVKAGSKRQIMLSARIREYGLDRVLEAVEKVRQSNYLRGGGQNGWMITFDWFLCPNNFVKVLEGNYDNRAAPPKPPERRVQEQHYEQRTYNPAEFGGLSKAQLEELERGVS